MVEFSPKFFKIFISSPGDVPGERDDAEAVIRELNESGEFSNHFILKPRRWDDKAVVLPMPVTDIPQKSVDIYMTRPSQCDLVVVLFWSRMGSPLVMDEREYLSGTHYEYSEALDGYRQVGKPTVWLYRCAEEPSIKLTDPKRDEKIQQFDRVLQFFKQFQDAEGRYTGGVNDYPTHTEFKSLFKGQLTTYLRHLRDTPRTEAPVVQKPPRFTGVPYRGLNALDEGDAPIFFGREAETLEVLSRVDNKRLVMVLGASGSGKSSLVAAGVLPKLRERGWRILRCVPGDDPFYNLSQAIVSQFPEMGVKPTDYLNEARKLADVLCQKPENLSQQIALTLPKQRVLLFIDQFEEVFTLSGENAHLSEFIQAVRHPSAQLTTLLTMRADFYGAALPYFEELKQQTYGLDRPSPFALYEMITRPAELAGLKLDDGLARKIVDEVGSESGGLALISYVLEALYLREQIRGDGVLSKQDYEVELNGVRGAINTLADQAYAALPFDDAARQKALQAVFRDLIAMTEDADGQLIPTRRRAALVSFQANSNEVLLIERFVQARLLVKDSQSVEVAHEAILRYWKALVAWIGAMKGDLALLRQIQQAIQEWEASGREVGYLLTGNRLADAERWLKVFPARAAEREYIEASAEAARQRQERDRKIARRVQNFERAAAVLGVMVVLAIASIAVAAVYADQKVREVGFIGLEINRFSTLNAADVVVPMGTQTPGIFEPMLTRIALLNAHTPTVQPFDGVPLVAVPAGCFYMGSTLNSDTQPIVQQCFDAPYWIGQTEVTNTQYQAFMDDDGYGQREYWTDAGWAWRNDTSSGEDRTQPRYWTDSTYNAPDQPVVGVSWYEAAAYAVWLTERNRKAGLLPAGQEIRLPTEAEWEYAARGPDSLRYPWGNEWIAANAVTADLQPPPQAPLVVGSIPAGASWVGALDMSGNVWEWVSTIYNSYPYQEDAEHENVSSDAGRVLRGGSFRSDQNFAAASYRSSNYPFNWNHYSGFRVVLGSPIRQSGL